jgi:glycosyltransferase involved in cell wall biosynthesis
MSQKRRDNPGNKKVCMLTSVHSAFDVRIFEKEARSLSAAGYDVTIVVPHGSDEESCSVRVKAVAHPRNRKRRMTTTVWEVYRMAVGLGASVYHFHDPELIPVGLLLKLRGKRVLYDVHEDLPRDILDKDWISPVLIRLVAKAGAATEAIGGLVFDGIIAATPTIATRFPSRKTILVQNFPQASLQEANGFQPYSERPRIASFVGGMTRHRGAREMVVAMSKLPESSNANLVIAGLFDPPALEQELHALPGWARVDYRAWQPRTKIDRLLNQSRLGLVLFHPFQNYMEAQPNKLFEYMSAGIPVIASDFPMWRQIVDKAGCGILVDPLDTLAIANAIQWIFDHPVEAEEMGRRGLAAVRSRYNWPYEEQKLLGFYSRLFNGHKS